MISIKNFHPLNLLYRRLKILTRSFSNFEGVFQLLSFSLLNCTS
ncbi:protein of unknown function [Candidatus Nitrosocosmicus franklandus]|uniref:Uncharacterized protein n=1 Tax=Candidatus Nitrosocosmicus franklandianus TaxID=1798806 RepID=A0A484I3M6_9ARCH|nr:protein of unknown function [Candidatus Nitrosocosmicus franklandus]